MIRRDLLTLLRGGPYNNPVHPPTPCSPDDSRPGTAIATGRLLTANWQTLSDFPLP